jgi:pyruvate dehydrogenase E1 component
MRSGSNGQHVSTTMAFTRLLRGLCRDEHIGPRVVPIVPDEARTFGMDALFRELEIYASQGQKYEPVDHDLLLSYSESTRGQILEEGITEAGSMSSFIAAGTAYATRGVPMLPFFSFYSMFGFQRVGDLIWQAADMRTRGFLMAATAGRTTLLGEGLQHQDGHSLVLASTVPAVQAYDPAFAYEVGAIVNAGIQRMYGGGPADHTDVFYYITLGCRHRSRRAAQSRLPPAAHRRGPRPDQRRGAALRCAGRAARRRRRTRGGPRADPGPRCRGDDVPGRRVGRRPCVAALRSPWRFADRDRRP